MKAARVTVDDLEFAVEWMSSYEGEESEENDASAQRIIAWLKNEIDFRREQAAIDKAARTLASERGRPYGEIRKLLVAKVKEQKAKGKAQ